MAEIKGTLSAGINLSGTLKCNGLPTTKQNTYSKVILTHADGVINMSATMPDDIIRFDFKPALKVADIDDIPTVNLNFGSCLDDDKPMAGTAVKAYVDSVNRGLELELEDLEEWLANTYISQNTYITTQMYEVETDESGYAAIPFSLENNQIAYVFVNGLIAVEGKDYQITESDIQIANGEFTSGNDVVTFVVFKPAVDTNTNKTISISSEIYEAETDSDGFAQLPFNYNNQLFYVFINGVFASEEDYQITNGGILTTNTEFVSGNDIITFVIFKPLLNGAESESLDMSLKIYKTQTDSNDCSTLPLVPKVLLKSNDNSVVQVFINGLYAVEGNDYQIENGNIQLTRSEAFSGNNVAAFVVFEAKVDSDNTGSSIGTIEAISDEEIDEIINN